MFENIKHWKPREREMFYNTKNTGLPLGAFGNI
jgi:hypothetical protein